MHQQPSPLAGTTVTLKTNIASEIAGRKFQVEDYWDRVSGKSWKVADGNTACMNYALRTGLQEFHVPMDDEVLYGKVGGFGHLVHISELEMESV